MRKLLTLVVVVLATALSAKAQNGLLANNFNSVRAGGAINLLNTAIVNHLITWNVQGTVSSCTVALDSSSDGITWSAGGVIAGQTCTSNGNSSTVNLNVNYVRMNVTAFSGTGSVTVTWTGNTALAGAGGLPVGCTSPGTGQLTCTGAVIGQTVSASSAAAQCINLFVSGGYPNGNFFGICAGASMAASLQYTAPLIDGSAGASLQTDGAQHMRWFGPVASSTPVTSSNPTINTDQNLIQLTLPAGYFNTLTQPFYIEASGIYSSTTASTPALTVKAKLCTVSGCGSGTIVPLFSIVTTALNTTALTNATFNLSGICVTSTIGTTGNLTCHGKPGLTLDTGATLSAPDTVFADTNTAVSSPNIDLTAALFLQFTIAQSVAGASNSYTQQLAAIR